MHKPYVVFGTILPCFKITTTKNSRQHMEGLGPAYNSILRKRDGYFLCSLSDLTVINCCILTFTIAIITIPFFFSASALLYSHYHCRSKSRDLYRQSKDRTMSQ